MCRHENTIILASSSPRRRELIAGLRLQIRVVPSGADEEIDSSLPPEEQATSLARRKVQSVATDYPGLVVLGADTLVVHRGEVLNKPVDLADAERMLRRLRGVDHLVHTGLAVVAPGGKASTAIETSTVRMRPFSDAELAAYLKTGESLDKAGAYGIQGAAGNIVESVEGCYTNVVGLPLCATARLLIAAGVRIDVSAPACGFRSDRRCPCWPTDAGRRQASAS